MAHWSWRRHRHVRVNTALRELLRWCWWDVLSTTMLSSCVLPHILPISCIRALQVLLYACRMHARAGHVTHRGWRGWGHLSHIRGTHVFRGWWWHCSIRGWSSSIRSNLGIRPSMVVASRWYWGSHCGHLIPLLVPLERWRCSGALIGLRGQGTGTHTRVPREGSAADPMPWTLTLSAWLECSRFCG